MDVIHVWLPSRRILPRLIICHDWINLQNLCLSWQQFNLKTVLNVTDYDVENQLLWFFLVRGGEMRKK